MSGPPRHDWTERDNALLRMAAEGRTDKEIARALGLTRRYVVQLMGYLRAEFDAANRAQMVAEAMRRGRVQ